MQKLLPTLAIITALVAAPALAALDEDSATVSMNVSLYASLTGLDDFVLNTAGTDGSAGSIYSGSDVFNLQSNGQVRVSLDGANLSNGVDSVATVYSMDDSGISFDTTIDAVHNASHSVSASATLLGICPRRRLEPTAL